MSRESVSTAWKHWHRDGEAGEADFDLDRVRKQYNLSTTECAVLEELRVDENEQKRILRLPQRSDPWLKARRLRVTASNFGAAIGRSRFKDPASLRRDIVFGSAFKGNKATQWGVDKEPVAAEAYLEWLDQHGSGDTEVCFPNLCVPRAHPWAGVSPDGFVRDGNAYGGLEIKCPYSQHVYRRRPEPYEDQIQGSMGFLGLSFWDFCVWTPRKMVVERVSFDREYWTHELFPRLEEFFMTSVLPAIAAVRAEEEAAAAEAAAEAEAAGDNNRVSVKARQ